MTLTTRTRRQLTQRTYQKFTGSRYALVHGLTLLERKTMTTNRICIVPKPEAKPASAQPKKEGN